MVSKVVVCCDGTWCGEATGTSTTNVKIIASAIAGEGLASGVSVTRLDGYATVCYFEGVGVGGTIWEYIVNGAIAEDIRDKVIEAYKFVVKEFSPGKKVWMVGFSRGAYTIRCVAGMINNIGIINRHGLSEVVLDDLCHTAYYMYRSRDSQYAPHGTCAQEFKMAYSHDYDYPPIEFMGLLDTVGSLGVPKIDPGTSLSYDFHDQNVSNEVQHVFQALATHDRLFAFEPCFARRRSNTAVQPVELWFPGAHYDIGRVQFIPFRRGRSVEGALRFVQSKTNVLGLNVCFTQEYSRNVCEWMARCIYGVDNNVLNLPAFVVPPLPPLLSPPLFKNAYDMLYDKVRWIPFVDSVFGKQVLRDRHVPIYRASLFYANAAGNADPESFLSVPSQNRSRTFDVRQSTIAIRPITWRR